MSLLRHSKRTEEAHRTDADLIDVHKTGRLCTVTGAVVDVEYRLSCRFCADRVANKWAFKSPRARIIRIVECRR